MGAVMFTAQGDRAIAGPNSRRFKSKNVICSDCNTTATSASDRAYDRLSDWMVAHQREGSGWSEMDLAEVFVPDYAAGVDQLYRYFAKALGCRLVSQGAVLPPEFFPNPVTGTKMERLRVSICRAESFRNVPGYDSTNFDRIMSNGNLHSSHSKIALDATGQRHILDAAWSTRLGHFQTNYWLSVPPNPAFGRVLTAVDPLYKVVSTDLDLLEIDGVMASWVDEHRQRWNARSRSGLDPWGDDS
jgi:hypothetical protein